MMTFQRKQTNPLSPMHWVGNMQADYIYPNGVAGDKFFQHLKKNDSFLATECPKCKKVFFPPRIYCEDCFVEIPENNWKEVPITGKIEIFTIAAIDSHGDKLETPKIVALIRIDQTHGATMGIVNSTEFERDFTNIKVKAVLKPKDKREGTLKDILYYETQ